MAPCMTALYSAVRQTYLLGPVAAFSVHHELLEHLWWSSATGW